ncbi:MAG: alpha/beta hydrolase [Leptolyngbya sp.]|nr:alpha/beta hydrolase [Leptolyngbya sp.]
MPMLPMTYVSRFRRFLTLSLAATTVAVGGACLEAFQPRSAHGAEDIRIYVTGPLVLSLSVDDLETLAQTGELPPSMGLYQRALRGSLRQQMQRALSMPLPLDVVTVDHLAYSPLGRDVLLNLGKVVQTPARQNGQVALRAAVINAAANAGPEGWTMIDVLRAFPAQSIHIDLADLLALRRDLALYFSYNRAANGAIHAQAAAEAQTQTALDMAALPDLSQPGPYSFHRDTITVTNPALRQTSTGLTVNYDFDADIYVPNGLTEPAPIVIVSHGFGDVKESFTFLAEHLASYGFIVMLPDHVGSNLAYRQTYLDGQLNTLLSPMEFINRPQEISFLIDQLEELTATSPQWAAIADVNRIGVVGDSLGSSTALALGGAEINYNRLVENCDQDDVVFNFALYLECRAQFLPPQNYDLKDPRVKAIITAHAMGGGMYGPEGFRQIDVPILMVAGENDIVSTVVTEQIHPFVWLQTPSKYLATFERGTHFTSKPGRDGAGGIFQLLAGQHRDLGSRYYKTLNVAFWNAHLRDQSEFLPYLTARYGEFLSTDQPMGLYLISELSAQQLEAAYGGPPPIPVIPAALAPTPPPRDESILAEIERTGVLTVGLRKDAAPFGFIDQTGAWDGYCGNLALSLGDYLTDHLNREVPIQVVEITSTLDNRYDLVKEGFVHLECGPNTLRTDVPGVVFSSPIFVSSAQFLTLANPANPVNPNLPLAGLRLGVLSNTTTETFVQSTYPQAERVLFPGPEGRQNAIQAVEAGTIDAFVGDGILTYATLLLDGKSPDNFALAPNQPLTCEFYGLALPENDPQWRRLVNQYLDSPRESAISGAWFADLYPAMLNQADTCLNR